MAGKAVARQIGVLRHQGPGCDHQVRIDETQCQQHQQVRGDHQQDPAALHFHPQNRNTATMCARASTPKARVMGK